MSSPNTPEPPPKPNTSPAIWDLVIEDMRERDQQGLAKYGTRLQADNGREPLVDAYQEALDLAVYLRQAIETMRAQRVWIAGLRARVIVNAEDVAAAGITVEHIKAWLTARGWAREGGVNTIGGTGGPWESWRSLELIERRRKVAEAMKSARGRQRMQPPDGPCVCFYIAPNDQQLAKELQQIAEVFGVVALDLLDELAESAKAERRSDPA